MSGSILPPTQKLLSDSPNLSFKFTPGRERVPSVRLDLFCADHGVEGIDVLHMDVQGAEGMVLQGLGALRPRMIFLETNESGDTGHYRGSLPLKELLGLLDAMGYDSKWSDASDALYVLRRPAAETEPAKAPPEAAEPPAAVSTSVPRRRRKA